MTLTGELFIGAGTRRSAETFRALHAASGVPLEPPFYVADPASVDAACELAWSAFQFFRALHANRRAHFLDEIAERLMASDELIDRATAESGLPAARLTGERLRTANQLRLFADELRRSGCSRVRVDPALPARKPQPRPELRQYQVAIGPVAVFGASNFPLAFSVAGGDTAAALAAGCPVVVKGHPAHPGTSELVARAIVSAARATAMPDGVFALLNGTSHELGTMLVRHPRIKAVGFTGSRAGGLALMQAAAARPQPIPVFAEMSSINPVILLPGALQANAEVLAMRFVESLTLGTGQFCTNPGMVIAITSPELDRFSTTATSALRGLPAGVMLTPAIGRAYVDGVQRLLNTPRTHLLAQGSDAGPQPGRAALFSVDAATLVQQPRIADEVFGPSSVLVRCGNYLELQQVLGQLEGQLTTAIHFTDGDLPLTCALLPALQEKAGRLIANGWPTGVEVSPAMVHGGPFPATSDGRSTSVGTLAIERFLRPVCYQDFPQALLPEALRDDVLRGYPHRYDGELRTGQAVGAATP